MAPAQAQKLIRRIRRELGWTVRKLADEVGVAHSTVLRWENGDRAIRENNVRLLKIIAEREGVRV